MSNPPNPYNRSYNFEDFQSLNPNSPLPAQHLENELNNIEQTLDATVSRLSEIQNADGSLKLTANVEQILLNAATVEATNVANQVSADYLAANFDSNAAASASSSANAAAQSALLAEASKVQANAYSVASQQSAVTANMNAVSAISSKNAAESYADNANASKIAAYGYKLSAQNAQIGASSVYQSALQLKENLDSNYGQLLYKREDVNHIGANILFNNGDINNTLIGKIFPGTSFDLNSKLVNEGPINATGLNYINGPWWVEGNAQAENPSDIVTRDMMNCLVQTWKTFGPNVARGELKPLQTGVNGTPNPAWSQTDYPNEKFIEPIVYDGEGFNTNQLDPAKVQNAALTPKGYVDKKLVNKLDFVNHEVSFKNGLDNINWKINNIETLSINYDSINLWRYPNQYFRTEIVGGGITLSSSIDGTNVLLNNERIEFRNSTGQITKLSSEDNLLKISTGIKFADGTTLTTAGGNYLPLTGGTMTGSIIFDEIGGQNIAKGSFDSGRGGYNGISLNCAVGYELNWQAGYLSAKQIGGGNVPINVENSSIQFTGATFGDNIGISADASDGSSHTGFDLITNDSASGARLNINWGNIEEGYLNRASLQQGGLTIGWYSIGNPVPNLNATYGMSSASVYSYGDNEGYQFIKGATFSPENVSGGWNDGGNDVGWILGSGGINFGYTDNWTNISSAGWFNYGSGNNPYITLNGDYVGVNEGNGFDPWNYGRNGFYSISGFGNTIDCNLNTTNAYFKIASNDIPDGTKIEPDGISFNGIKVSEPHVQNSQLTQSGNIAHSDYPKELFITIDGVQYAIPARLA